MKNFTLLLIVSSITFFNRSTAQQFVNGSFEPKAAISKCKYDSTSKFNANMGGMWVTGADTGMFVADNSCGMGSPADGNYYAGTSYKAMTGSNYIMLRLTKPMTAGVKYKFSFKYKGPATGTALSVLLGFSNDSLSHANFAHGIVAPTGSSWQTVNDSITPTAASKYIWIAGGSGGGDGQIYFDHFVMVENTTAVPQAGIIYGIDIFPNPVADVSHIRLNAETRFPVSVTITDITGKVMMQNSNDYRKDIAINKTQLSNGINILKITDADNNSYITKLIAE